MPMFFETDGNGGLLPHRATEELFTLLVRTLSPGRRNADRRTAVFRYAPKITPQASTTSHIKVSVSAVVVGNLAATSWCSTSFFFFKCD